MPNVFSEWLKRLRAWWGAMDPNHQGLAVIGGGVLAVGLVGVALFTGRPDYTPLFSSLDPKDANEIVEFLREQKVPYRLGGGGTQVEVPSRRVYELRVRIAGKGLPRGSNAGFELFDKLSFGTTDEVQRINYLRALQSELERTIEALDPVAKARVHLVIPQEDLWFEDSNAPTASVMLKLRSAGPLLPHQVESVRHLVGSAVRGLSAERVTVVDTEGHVFSAAGGLDGSGGMSDRQISYQQKVEADLKQQAESLLGQILGPNRAAVRVHAEIDFSQSLTERESYTPVVGRQGLVRSEKQNMFESASEAAGTAGGAAGTPANLQGYPPSAGGAGGDKNTRKNEKTINYEMNRTVEKINAATGAVRRLSVGVFLDGKLKPEQVADITSVLAKGLGISTERGDTMEVKAMPFNHEALEAERKLLERSQKERFWLQLASRWLPLAALLGAGLAFVFFGLKNLQRALATAGPAGNEHSGNGDGMNPDKVLALLKQNSSGSAQVLKHWLS